MPADDGSLLRAELGIPGVHAVTTLRGPAGVSSAPFDRFNLGLRCGDQPEAVLANRDALIDLARLPGAPHWLRQVHGTRVWQAEAASDEGDEPEADAAVTFTPGTVLTVLTADCLPVVFAADVEALGDGRGHRVGPSQSANDNPEIRS